MVIIPLVFASIVMGIVNLGDIQHLGKVGLRTVLYFVFSTAIAGCIGLGIGSVFLSKQTSIQSMSHSLPGALQKEPASLQTLILEIIPQNVVHVMAEGLVLPVIFFAILLAVGLLSIGEKGRPLVALIESLNDVILKIVDWIMVLTPYGVLALISGVVSNTGLSGLKQLLQYMLVV